MKLEKMLVKLGKFSLMVLIIAVFSFLGTKAPLVLKFSIGYLCGYIICDLSRYLDSKVN